MQSPLTEVPHSKTTFKIDIYNILCVVAVTSGNVRDLAKAMDLSSELIEDLGDRSAAFSKLVVLPNNETAVLMIYDIDYLDHDAIQHETNHAGFYIMEYIGHDLHTHNGGDEPLIYLQSYIGTQTRKWLKQEGIKIND